MKKYISALAIIAAITVTGSAYSIFGWGDGILTIKNYSTKDAKVTIVTSDNKSIEKVIPGHSYLPGMLGGYHSETFSYEDEFGGENACIDRIEVMSATGDSKAEMARFEKCQPKSVDLHRKGAIKRFSTKGKWSIESIKYYS